MPQTIAVDTILYKDTSLCAGLVLAAKEAGKQVVCVPRENIREAQIVKGITILPGKNLNQVIELIGCFFKGDWKNRKNSDNNIEGMGIDYEKMDCDFASSKNNTPLWARLISPGFGTVPPPAIPARLMV